MGEGCVICRGQSEARYLPGVQSEAVLSTVPVCLQGQSGAARTLRGRTVAAHGGSCAGEENAAKKQKGSKGYPKGVIETGRDTIKYQARVSYKPDGGKTVQRSAGTFNTPEEALKAVSFLYWLFRHSRRFRDEKEDGRCM